MIGGQGPGAGNLVSGNPHNGINLFGADGNIVQGNIVGTDVAGTNSPPNAFHGVSLGISNDSRIKGNLIANNGLDGVTISSGTGNVVTRNEIFSNDGLGIELAPLGLTPNDSGDGDTGPNNLQNFPVLTSARATPSQLVVRGTIDTPNPRTITIEIFANPVPIPGGDPSGHGEGAIFLGAVRPNSRGKFTATLAAVPGGTLITATATDAARTTSEFAENIAATRP